MAETDFDVIVVGSGCAGAVAAYTAASAGKSVLVGGRGYFLSLIHICRKRGSSAKGGKAATTSPPRRSPALRET